MVMVVALGLLAACYTSDTQPGTLGPVYLAHLRLRIQIRQTHLIGARKNELLSNAYVGFAISNALNEPGLTVNSSVQQRTTNTQTFGGNASNRYHLDESSVALRRSSGIERTTNRLTLCRCTGELSNQIYGRFSKVYLENLSGVSISGQSQVCLQQPSSRRSSCKAKVSAILPLQQGRVTFLGIRQSEILPGQSFFCLKCFLQ